MINIIRERIRSLSTRAKLLLLINSDLLMAMMSWIIFGPPLINFIGTEFRYSIFETIFNQFLQFLIPAVSAISFMWFFGFYKSLIKFFDSMDVIFTAAVGSLIFGFGWTLIYIGQINSTIQI